MKKHKTTKIGRPRDVRAVVVDRQNPDNYPSLVAYLEATGKVKHTTYATMCRARHMFLRFVPTEHIAVALKTQPAIIDRWALCFAWEEERDRRVFQQFRKIAGSTNIFNEDIGKRHERIAGGIEQILERFLEEHANGKVKLSAKDLNTITTTLKSTQEIRRTSRGTKKELEDKNTHLHLHIPSNLDRLAGVIADASVKPQLKSAPTKTIAVGVEESIGSDVEFETERED